MGPALMRAWHCPLLTHAHQYILLSYQSKTKTIILKNHSRKLYGESNCLSLPFCIHSVFFLLRVFFLQMIPHIILCLCRHEDMGGWGHTLLHLAFVAFQHVLQIFPYPFLQVCLILLKGCLTQPVKAPRESLMHSQVWSPQID